MDHTQLIEERGQDYGNAWSATGEWIAAYSDHLRMAGERSFVLVMIHNKLVRALTSPMKRDHYDDVCGYAFLALRSLGVTSEPAWGGTVEQEQIAGRAELLRKQCVKWAFRELDQLLRHPKRITGYVAMITHCKIALACIDVLQPANHWLVEDSKEA